MNNKYTPGQSRKGKNINFGFLFFLVMMIVAGIFYLLNDSLTSLPEIAYSEFLEALTGNKVIEVQITNDTIIEGVMISANGTSSGDRSFFKTIIPYNDGQLMRLLQEHNVIVSGIKKDPGFFSTLIETLPVVVVMMFFFFLIIRQNSAANNKGMQFGKSRARIYSGGKSTGTGVDRL